MWLPALSWFPGAWGGGNHNQTSVTSYRITVIQTQIRTQAQFSAFLFWAFTLIPADMACLSHLLLRNPIPSCGCPDPRVCQSVGSCAKNHWRKKGRLQMNLSSGGITTRLSAGSPKKAPDFSRGMRRGKNILATRTELIRRINLSRIAFGRNWSGTNRGLQKKPELPAINLARKQPLGRRMRRRDTFFFKRHPPSTWNEPQINFTFWGTC